MKQNNKLSAFFLGGDVKKDCFKELFMSKYITDLGNLQTLKIILPMKNTSR